MKLVANDWNADDAARERIRYSLDESLLVEAAAGTGKTTVLIHRLVALLASGRATVEGIVAVTFTRKAAGELKLRLRQELDKTRGDAERRGAAEEGKRLEAAIGRLEEARIGTIHSFCADILRERPVEAGVDPDFGEVADDEGPRLFRRAFEGFMQKRLESMPPGLRRALSRLAVAGRWQEPPLERLRRAGWELAEWRDFPAPWRRTPFDRESTIDRIVEQVQRIAGYARRCTNTGDRLRRALAPALVLDTWLSRGTRLSLGERLAERDYDELEARLLEVLVELRRHERDGKRGGKFAEGLPREQVVEERRLLIECLDLFRQAADADLASLLHGELGEAIAEYEELKSRLGKLDFTDLLLRTRELLRHHEAVRRHLQRRFTHLFVDEFQDTDPLQAEILLLLAADEQDGVTPAGAKQEVTGGFHFAAAPPKPGKLFFVGDPKQSIYRFRRADIQIYQRIKENLQAAGVGLVELQRSFRAVAPIQRFVNAAFAGEMDGDTTAGRPQYIELGEFRQPLAEQPALVALPVPRPYGNRGLSWNKVESEQPAMIAAFLDFLIRRSGWKVSDPQSGELVAIQARHICLLFRRYVSWGSDVTRDYVRALEVRRIPHVLVGQRSFHQREEVETLQMALRAIEWPEDELAVFSVLRGALYSFADETLLLFSKHHGAGFHPFRWRGRWRGHRESDLPGAAAARGANAVPTCDPTTDPEVPLVGEAMDRLARLHRLRNRRPIVETLQELLATVRAHAGFALRPAGQQVLANVERVCDLARSYEISGGRSFRGFVEKLAEEAARPGSTQTPLVEEGAEGVRLMTVHTAKGLEFPVVVLADMTARIAAREPDRAVDAELGLAASRILGCAPLELRERAAIEKQRDEAEGTRIAYVAATRARDLLVVPALGDGNPWSDRWLSPLAKALYPPREQWRKSSPAPGCPDFGASSVLERPMNFDGQPDGSVRPGLHRFAAQTYDIVWWDPAILDLDVEGGHGLRHEELLVDGEDSSLGAEAGRSYDSWKASQSEIRRRGALPSRSVVAVTMLEEEGPADPVEARVEEVKRPAGRPTGRRFGELVHSVLRVVALDDDSSAIERAALWQGRVLEAESSEVKAAAEAVRSALQHPLLERARHSLRLLREAPFTLPLPGDRLLEGTIDLAFEEAAGWVVVDFKTDVQVDQTKYRRQIAWYCRAVAELTGAPVTEAVLLGV